MNQLRCVIERSGVDYLTIKSDGKVNVRWRILGEQANEGVKRLSRARTDETVRHAACLCTLTSVRTTTTPGFRRKALPAVCTVEEVMRCGEKINKGEEEKRSR